MNDVHKMFRVLAALNPFAIFTLIQPAYREPLKGSSQVVRICGGKIASSCLQKVNKTQLSHLISHNLGRA